LLDSMPSNIGYSKVYCPDRWPERRYCVQAVYDNTNYWHELASKLDKTIISILRKENEVLKANASGMQDTVAIYQKF